MRAVDRHVRDRERLRVVHRDGRLRLVLGHEPLPDRRLERAQYRQLRHVVVAVDRVSRAVRLRSGVQSPTTAVIRNAP